MKSTFDAVCHVSNKERKKPRRKKDINRQSRKAKERRIYKSMLLGLNPETTFRLWADIFNHYPSLLFDLLRSRKCCLRIDSAKQREELHFIRTYRMINRRGGEEGGVWDVIL